MANPYTEAAKEIERGFLKQKRESLNLDSIICHGCMHKETIAIQKQITNRVSATESQRAWFCNYMASVTNSPIVVVISKSDAPTKCLMKTEHSSNLPEIGRRVHIRLNGSRTELMGQVHESNKGKVTIRLDLDAGEYIMRDVDVKTEAIAWTYVEDIEGYLNVGQGQEKPL